MLKYAAIKKYGYKLLPRLQKRYGEHFFIPRAKFEQRFINVISTLIFCL